MEGEKVLLKVSPTKGVMRFGRKGKLSPRYVGPFKVLERMGEVAYMLALPTSLSRVYPVFHISMLQKYHEDKSHVFYFNTVQLDENLAYEEELVAILDRQVQKLRSKEIASVKVHLRDQSAEEATWETEHDMWRIYPHLFGTLGMILNSFEDKCLFKTGRM
ncbi:uncharacterized protein [Nicotiana tomentosiformis]|uniref:uncharacterized protein n=1 Tax=Nicotiana tomentosiformis TaxID=4098 RepID=UPI00388CAFAA